VSSLSDGPSSSVFRMRSSGGPKTRRQRGRIAWVPVHVRVGRSLAVSVAPDEPESIHEVVPGFIARRGTCGHELGDEGTIGASGVEKRQGLGKLAGLHRLVSYIVPIEALTEEPADERDLVQCRALRCGRIQTEFVHRPLSRSARISRHGLVGAAASPARTCSARACMRRRPSGSRAESQADIHQRCTKSFSTPRSRFTLTSSSTALSPASNASRSWRTTKAARMVRRLLAGPGALRGGSRAAARSSWPPLLVVEFTELRCDAR